MVSAQNYVALLGTKGGPSIRHGSTMPTSSLVCLGGRHIVVDCGLGVARGLVDQGMNLRDLGLIFVTHLHSDHYLELGPLIHTAWTAGLSTHVNVFGPVGLQKYWENFLASMEDDIALRIEDEGRPDLATLVTVEVLEAGTVFSEDGLTIHAIRNEHPPLVDTFALSFKSSGNGTGKSEEKHVVFSGDTAYFPPLVNFAKGADLLVHEAMLEAALDSLMQRVGGGERLMNHWLRSHTFAADAACIARDADVKALALHHLIPSDDPNFTHEHWQKAVLENWSGVLHLGHDGMLIDLD